MGRPDKRQFSALGRYLLVGAFCSFLLGPLGAQELNLANIQALEEFRSGVTAFHNGFYNRAVIAFERSLGLNPENSRTHFWLGLSLYHSGFEESALGQWINLLETGRGNPVLANTVEVLRSRRGLDRQIAGVSPLLSFFELQGRVWEEDNFRFLRPSSVRPLPNGGFVLSAFGSEEVLTVSPNGEITRRLAAGAGGLQGPFDVLPWRGEYVVSEFVADRISVLDELGFRQRSFGESGRGPGQLLGPQYLADDGEAYFYVTDWGNRRVSKWDYEGNFIQSFGQAVLDYPGLQGPSGILVLGNQILVADRERAVIDIFDPSGNFIQTLGQDILESPEGLSLRENGSVMVADGSEILLLDLETEDIRPLEIRENPGYRYLFGSEDRNGNIILADFDNSSVHLLAESQRIYGGLFVRILRIVAREYPQVYIEILVEDRWGRPVVGLDSRNFIVSETATFLQLLRRNGQPPATEDETVILVQDEAQLQTRPGPDGRNYVYRSRSLAGESLLEEYLVRQVPNRVPSVLLDYQGFAFDGIDVALLVDRSRTMAPYLTRAGNAAAEIASVFESRGGVWVYSTQESPRLQIPRRPGQVLESRALAADPATLGNQTHFDSSLRLAASQVVPSLGRRAVVYLTEGRLGPDAFNRYDLLELNHYLRNNRVALFVVSLSGEVDPELQYLVEESGGQVYSALDPRGLQSLPQDILSLQTGTYILQYQGVTPTDFGRRYIPVSVEVNYHTQSGRTELGYFAPLE